ncbi:hypothetical protein NDU88_000258 [Pleurodeles waltl]|uniref:Uncharacterized protein n=1 Tax=Pleurodeles waltl TaxID=8319 RepID=A0AAV7TEF6_PLEWA|nr:hypothetical protein NDU88_000258 [Pleurodeles waltl]
MVVEVYCLERSQNVMKLYKCDGAGVAGERGVDSEYPGALWRVQVCTSDPKSQTRREEQRKHQKEREKPEWGRREGEDRNRRTEENAIGRKTCQRRRTTEKKRSQRDEVTMERGERPQRRL